MPEDKKTFRVVTGNENILVDTLRELTLLDAMQVLATNISEGVYSENARTEEKKIQVGAYKWKDIIASGSISIVDAQNNHCYTIDFDDAEKVVACVVGMDIVNLQSKSNYVI